MNNDPDKTAFRADWHKFRGKREAGIGTALDIVLESHGAMTDSGQTQAQWICEAATDQQIETLLALLKSGEHKTQGELATAMGCSQGAVSKLRKKAIAKDIISEKAWMGYLNRAKSFGSQGDGGEAAFAVTNNTDENPDF